MMISAVAGSKVATAFFLFKEPLTLTLRKGLQYEYGGESNGVHDSTTCQIIWG